MADEKSIRLVDVYARIRAACRAAGSQRAWAEQHGMTDAWVSAVLHAKRAPSPAMLRALGLRMVVRYVEVGQVAR